MKIDAYSFSPPFSPPHLKWQPKDAITLKITTADGRAVRTLAGTRKSGINRVLWDLRDANQYVLPPGEYEVTLGDRKLTQKARILSNGVRD